MGSSFFSTLHTFFHVVPSTKLRILRAFARRLQFCTNCKVEFVQTGIGPTPQASMKRPEGSLHAEPHGQWISCPVLYQCASWTAVFASLGSADPVPCAASKFTTTTS